MIHHNPYEPHAFTQVPNEILRHPDLSSGAVRLLCLMKSHREGFRFSERQLVRSVAEGRAWVNTRVGELEEHGYLVRSKARRPDGSATHSIWLVSWVPMDPDAAARALDEIRDRHNLLPFRNPDSETNKPWSENPTTVDGTTKNTKEKNTTASDLQTSARAREEKPTNREPEKKKPGGYERKGIEDLEEIRNEPGLETRIQRYFELYEMGCPPIASMLRLALELKNNLSDEHINDYLEERLSSMTVGGLSPRQCIVYLQRDVKGWQPPEAATTDVADDTAEVVAAPGGEGAGPDMSAAEIARELDGEWPDERSRELFRRWAEQKTEAARDAYSEYMLRLAGEVRA